MHVLTLLILVVNDHHDVQERRQFTPHKMLLAVNSMCSHAETSQVIRLGLHKAIAHSEPWLDLLLYLLVKCCYMLIFPLLTCSIYAFVLHILTTGFFLLFREHNHIASCRIEDNKIELLCLTNFGHFAWG